MKTISFKTTKSEMRLIALIAARAVKMAKTSGFDYKFSDADMDVTACHANGNPGN